MRRIAKEIDRERTEIAQKLSPVLATQRGLRDVRESMETVDVDSGKSYQQKRRKQKVTMNGTSQSFSFKSSDGFKDYSSVVITLSAPSHVAMYAQMNAPNKFTITAASAVTDLDITVLMRGD